MAQDQPSFRQERRRRVRELRDRGYTNQQIARALAAEYDESLLKAFRWTHDWSLAEAAEHYNNDVADDPEHESMSGRRLSEYENWPRNANSTPPRLTVLQGFAKLYQCAPGDLIEGTDYTKQPDRPAGSEPVRRGQFNKAMLALAASLVVDTDRLTTAQTVDEALLADLESLTADLARRQHFARPHVVLGPIRAHLNYLLGLHDRNVPPHLRPRLSRVTASTAAIAGWIAFRGFGDLVSAHAQMALGHEHAQQAGDDALMAQLLAASSSLHSSLDLPRADADRASPPALSQLRTAQRKVGAGATPLHGWLAVRIATELALFGEARTARAALTQAEATLPNSPPRDPGGLFCLWDETRFAGFTGKTLLILRDPAATGFLEHALTVTSAPHPRLGLLVDLAVAKVGAGDADAAVALLVEAAQLAVGHGIDGFARWRLAEGGAELPAAQQRAFEDQLPALA